MPQNTERFRNGRGGFRFVGTMHRTGRNLVRWPLNGWKPAAPLWDFRATLVTAGALLPTLCLMSLAAQLVSCSLPRASGAGWIFPPNGWHRRRTANPEQEMAPGGTKEIMPDRREGTAFGARGARWQSSHTVGARTDALAAGSGTLPAVSVRQVSGYGSLCRACLCWADDETLGIFAHRRSPAGAGRRTGGAQRAVLH